MKSLASTLLAIAFSTQDVTPRPAPVVVWAYGDSKSAYGYHPLSLDVYLLAEATWEKHWWVRAFGISGASTTSLAARVDADLAGLDAKFIPRYVMISLGSNDISAAQETLETNYAAIADAIHAKWPSALVGITRPWVRTKDDEADVAAAAVAAVVATRSPWCVVGPDEKVLLRGSDDGVTYTIDGIHPNTAGAQRLATQWRVIFGI